MAGTESFVSGPGHAANVLVGIEQTLSASLDELERVMPDIPAGNPSPAINLDLVLRFARTQACQLAGVLRSCRDDAVPPAA